MCLSLRLSHTKKDPRCANAIGGGVAALGRFPKPISDLWRRSQLPKLAKKSTPKTRRDLRGAHQTQLVSSS